MKLSRKIVSACVTGALLLTSVGMSVSAVKSNHIDVQYSSNFNKDFTVNYGDFFYGYYQKPNSSWFWGHNARAGTHFLGSGGLDKVNAVTFVYYVDKSGKTGREVKDCTIEKDGWAKTPWAEVPDSAITPYRVVFRGNWYYKSGDIAVNSLRIN